VKELEAKGRDYKTMMETLKRVIETKDQEKE